MRYIWWPRNDPNGKLVPADEIPAEIRGEVRGWEIVPDIEPYQTVAADRNGKSVVIGSRREHKEFLKRNGYVEVGNSVKPPTGQPLDITSGRDIKRAIEEIRSRR
jgi:hypothetical protein